MILTSQRYKKQWLTGLVMLLYSCSPSPPPQLYDKTQKLHPIDYMNVLSTWTRSARIYHFLDNKLFITATYHAEQLRQAFSVAFPDIYGHGGRITHQELAELAGEAAHYHNFFLSIHTPDRRWNDLHEPDSIWHLTLHSSTASLVNTAKILAIKIDENIRAVYPYLTRFDKAYLVRFPQYDSQGQPLIGRQTRFFTLKIASALGVAQLHWQLSPITQKF